MTSAQLNGIEIAYETHGSGFPVLLTHGYSATLEMWRGQVEPVGAKYRLITWDMRGHGQTDSPDDPAMYSEAKTVDDMAALLDHVGAPKAVIGGLSLGGYMSLAFNLKYADRVAALMLFDCGPGYRKDEPRAAWNETAMQRAQNFEQNGLAAMGASAEVLVARHRSAQGLAHAARGMLAQVDSRAIDSLEHIRVPTLVLVGANDTPFINASQYMAAKIPGAKLAVIPGAGHAANIDQPAAFNAAVLEFLDGLNLA
ncbi:MAG: alpha/beta fold hydrolase [Dehalococcoidia bacterium]|nr:alpha/beta fold hydrolase [Dehalococcoidia bacterium]